MDSQMVQSGSLLSRRNSIRSTSCGGYPYPMAVSRDAIPQSVELGKNRARIHAVGDGTPKPRRRVCVVLARGFCVRARSHTARASHRSFPSVTRARRQMIDQQDTSAPTKSRAALVQIGAPIQPNPPTTALEDTIPGDNDTRPPSPVEDVAMTGDGAHASTEPVADDDHDTNASAMMGVSVVAGGDVNEPGACAVVDVMEDVPGRPVGSPSKRTKLNPEKIFGYPERAISAGPAQPAGEASWLQEVVPLPKQPKGAKTSITHATAQFISDFNIANEKVRRIRHPCDAEGTLTVENVSGNTL